MQIHNAMPAEPVKAVQFNGGQKNMREVLKWLWAEGQNNARGVTGYFSHDRDKSPTHYPEHISVNSMNGEPLVFKGDWIIQTQNGAFKVMTTDTFQGLYNVVFEK